MKLDEFFSTFRTEEACKQHFKAQREFAGLVCRKCSGTKHYWIAGSNRWQCKNCKCSQTLKCGTVMENSNLGYKVWLWAIYLMAMTKKGFSAAEMQRMVGHKRYEPIWLLMHKLRIAMGNREAEYKLDGFIEMDEGFFEGIRKKDDETGPVVKPAKELDRQVKAIVAVTTTPIEIDKRKNGRPITKAGYLKINVVTSLGKFDIEYETKKMIAPDASVTTDGKTSYRVLKEVCKKHIEIVIKDKTKICKALPWVHTAISNAKKKILGLHHHVSDEYMQNYFNEFCYKFNRRYFGENLFYRLFNISISSPWYGGGS